MGKYISYGPRRRKVDLRRAVRDDEYYAEIRCSLHGAARREFERAVDELWSATAEAAR